MKSVIYIVGIGPGDEEYLTAQARSAIEKSDIVVGYTVYTELVRRYFPDKEYRTTGMRQELKRCRLCFELAGAGKTVSLCCSGDAGVYGMASPMYELLSEEKEIAKNTELVVVPGITAALSGAALLGAPLGHDFCVISLSDLLTPWEVIEGRLTAAVQGDFVIVLYNPGSHRRVNHLARACKILQRAGADGNRVCGTAENIGREGEAFCVCSLEELSKKEVTMFTTVFVGNSRTRMREGKMVTPRGYLSDDGQ